MIPNQVIKLYFSEPVTLPMKTIKITIFVKFQFGNSIEYHK